MDIISSLPEALIGHILSFLPTKEAVSTSLLSKTWRYLFALSPNLDFDDSVLYNRPEISAQKRDHRMLMDSVDRVLRLQGNSTINKFSLDCLPGAFPPCVSRWIQNVMERGVSDLDLCVTVSWDDMMPGSVFVSKSLVRLRIKTWNLTEIDVDDVFLPNLKSLHLDSVKFRYSGKCPLFKLVSGCHVLEELVLIEVRWNDYWNLSLSSKTLKRLTLRYDERGSSPYLVSLDTPNLVFFDYADSVSKMYQIVNFDSLVEASIDLRMTGTQFAHSFYYEDMVGNATDLLTRISNVQTLYLTADTLEVLSFCGEQIPVFKNVIHLNY